MTNMMIDYRFASNNHEENVQFLTRLIRETEASAVTYQLPTDARQYQPNQADIEGNLICEVLNDNTFKLSFTLKCFSESTVKTFFSKTRDIFFFFVSKILFFVYSFLIHLTTIGNYFFLFSQINFSSAFLYRVFRNFSRKNSKIFLRENIK